VVYLVLLGLVSLLISILSFIYDFIIGTIIYYDYHPIDDKSFVDFSLCCRCWISGRNVLVDLMSVSFPSFAFISDFSLYHLL